MLLQFLAVMASLCQNQSNQLTQGNVDKSTTSPQISNPRNSLWTNLQWKIWAYHHLSITNAKNESQQSFSANYWMEPMLDLWIPLPDIWHSPQTSWRAILQYRWNKDNGTLATNHNATVIFLFLSCPATLAGQIFCGNYNGARYMPNNTYRLNPTWCP